MKKILLISTGGTISCKRTAQGLSPIMSSQEIISFVPEVQKICEITTLSLINKDSTEIDPSDWLQLAKIIEMNYGDYDGFVICHGTDTMAYTASALSYLIQNSQKPIILTGAQKPIDMEITDAKTNLFDSFLYATSPYSNGIQIVFGGKVIISTRARKTKTKSFDAFSSVNFPLIGSIQDRKLIHYIKNRYIEDVKFYDKLNTKVAIYKLIPSSNPEILDFILSKNDAVVIESYGTGGIPSSHNKVLEKYSKSSKIIVMATQVAKEGSDIEIYKVGKHLKTGINALEVYDMNIESAVAKLMWILSITNEQEKVHELFYSTIYNDILLTT